MRYSIGSLLSLYSKLKTAKRLIRMNREGFVFIWRYFGRLFQDNVYLFLECLSLSGIKPVIPVFNAFPGANHKLDRRVFHRAQGLSGNIALRNHSLETQRPYSPTEFFFFSGFDLSINKDLDGHDRSSVMSQCKAEGN